MEQATAETDPAEIKAACEALKALSEEKGFVKDYGVREVRPEVLEVISDAFDFKLTFLGTGILAANFKIGVTFIDNSQSVGFKEFFANHPRNGNWLVYFDTGYYLNHYEKGMFVRYIEANFEFKHIEQRKPQEIFFEPADLGHLTPAEASKLHQIMQNEPEGFVTEFTKDSNTYTVNKIDDGIEIYEEDSTGKVTKRQYRAADGYIGGGPIEVDKIKFAALGKNTQLSDDELLTIINEEGLWIKDDKTLCTNLESFGGNVDLRCDELVASGVENRFFKDLDTLSFRQGKGNILWLNEWLVKVNQANAPPEMAVILEGILTHEARHTRRIGITFEEYKEEIEAVTAECAVYTNAIKAKSEIKDNILTK